MNVCRLMVVRSGEADGDREGEDFAEEGAEEVDPGALTRLPRPFHSRISASFSRGWKPRPYAGRQVARSFLHTHQFFSKAPSDTTL